MARVRSCLYQPTMKRDFEFAQKYQLPIKPVIKNTDDQPHDFNQAALTATGILINSGEFNGLNFEQAWNNIENYLTTHQKGGKKINYRLRDWSISRQRYWGTPVPMINCAQCGTLPVPEQDLPVLLPEEVNFTGATSPLKNMPEFLNVQCHQCGGSAQRETDTFDTFMESSWYYARFACRDQNKTMLDDRARYWTPVDHYIGGIEHAVMHLLYARFYHKLLRDEGLLNSDEPFMRLLTQGMVLKDGTKMSKSKGNTVDPNELIAKYGADTVRLFIIFAAPPEQSLEWSDTGVEGAYRFLKRLWNFAFQQQKIISEINFQWKNNSADFIDWNKISGELRHYRKQMHSTLQQARYDYERNQFNTVVSSCMKLLNLLQEMTTAKTDEISTPILNRLIQKGFSILLRLLAPIVPHITHVLWQSLDFEGEILTAKWPKPSADALQMDEVEMVVQINGKLRSKITITTTTSQKEIEQIVLKDEQVQRYLQQQTPKKIIIVPNKLINIVV